MRAGKVQTVDPKKSRKVKSSRRKGITPQEVSHLCELQYRLEMSFVL